MTQTLAQIAETLKANNKKAQLIYAFNSSGKTRLSKEFKNLISGTEESEEEAENRKRKIIYYNAFTEDLFYWDNDLENDDEPKLKIQPNDFTNWVLIDQGKDADIIDNFQKFANNKLTPKFNELFSRITFSFKRGDDSSLDYIKISKGEESLFIWSVFYSLFQQIIEILNISEEERDTEQFNDLEYIFIDDPVSSLDDNHLIELAVNLAKLIKTSTSELKFIVTTHNPLFYNVLYNELNNKTTYMLQKHEDGTFSLEEKYGDSNTCFSYHLHLKHTIEQAIENDSVQKYHFTLLRNLYEKTACFLGYPKWSELLPGDKEAYYNRIIQFTSHSTLSSEAVAEPTAQEKKTIDFLLRNLVENYNFWEKVENNV